MARVADSSSLPREFDWQTTEVVLTPQSPQPANVGTSLRLDGGYTSYELGHCFGRVSLYYETGADGLRHVQALLEAITNEGVPVFHQLGRMRNGMMTFPQVKVYGVQKIVHIVSVCRIKLPNQ